MTSRHLRTLWSFDDPGRHPWAGRGRWGKVKATVPKDGTGNFRINVDVSGLNDCSGDETQAELTLILKDAVYTITLERKTDSKFQLKKSK